MQILGSEFGDIKLIILKLKLPSLIKFQIKMSIKWVGTSKLKLNYISDDWVWHEIRRFMICWATAIRNCCNLVLVSCGNRVQCRIILM